MAAQAIAMARLDPRTGLRPYHIVQISLDAQILSPDKDPEPLHRQIGYARSLAARLPGSRMAIVVMAGDSVHDRLEEENLTVLPGRRSFVGWFRLYAQLRELHKQHPIDVITTQTISIETAIALVFARRHGCRVIGQIHYDLFSPYAQRQFRGGRLRRAFEQRLFRYLYAVRVVGERLGQRLLDERWHWNVQVVPVGIRKTARVRVADKIGRRVLYVGRLAPEKGLDDWLDVAAKVIAQEPSAEFEIVGDGPLHEALVARARELGVAGQVRFSGYVRNDRLHEKYAGARVLLLMSHYEGFGRVAVEAGANGVAVVGPRIPGLEDIVKDGVSGFLHEPMDQDGLAASVLRLLRSPELARTLGNAGRAIVDERFDPARLTEQWVDLLVSAALPRIPSLVPPRRRSFRRWRHLGASKLTILRSLEYEALRGLPLTGRTLDIGGGLRTSYRDLLVIRGELVSVNIDAKVQPSVRADLNAGLPFPSNSFDNVISFNTLEHIRRDEYAVAEAIRTLRPGGQFHFIVPFLYQVHGSPSDYHRHTLYWWIDCLKSLGITESALQVEPLVWDRLSSAYSFIGHGPIGLWFKRFVMLPAVFEDLGLRDERLPDTPRTRRLLDVTLGYYLRGTK